ncbi:MAG: RluA family pseudouridine synthase, partial [Bdellovibrionota bacterium]
MDSPPDRADLTILKAIETGKGRWESGKPISCSRSQLKRLIEDGHVTSDGKQIKANAKIRTGSEIIILFPAPVKMDLLPEDIPLEFLFQDEHLLVVNKPPGLTVHPSSTQKEGTLVHALLHHVKNLSGIGGVLRPGIVHRLDKDTSGVLVVSKTDQAHRALVESFSRHDIERVYWALCYGSPKVTGSLPLKVESY